MSRIKGKDTSIEKILRSALYKEGYRYRLQVSSLPGRPDILLCKYKIVIFCDGDFFHGYDYQKIDKELKTNKAYWENKIKTNQKRDRKNDALLVEQGYTVLHFWEHEIRENLPQVLREIDDAVYKKQQEKQEEK